MIKSSRSSSTSDESLKISQLAGPRDERGARTEEVDLHGPGHHLHHHDHHLHRSVRKRGSERTEAGESALPAEESPWRLRALSRERELLEFYKKTASISSRERENRITLLAVVLFLLTPT